MQSKQQASRCSTSSLVRCHCFVWYRGSASRIRPACGLRLLEGTFHGRLFSFFGTLGILEVFVLVLLVVQKHARYLFSVYW